MCITNLKKLTEEDSIFSFDLCVWKFTDDQDNDASISDKIKTPLVTGHECYRNKTVKMVIT